MGPEFYAAFQVAKLALAGIRSCVDMLNEGKGELQAVTGDIKKGVESAQAIYKEVTGFWSWLQNLFGMVKPKPTALALPVAEPKREAAPSAAATVQPVSSEGPSEDDVIETFLTHFTNFVEAQTVILDAISD